MFDIFLYDDSELPINGLNSTRSIDMILWFDNTSNILLVWCKFKPFSTGVPVEETNEGSNASTSKVMYILLFFIKLLISSNLFSKSLLISSIDITFDSFFFKISFSPLSIDLIPM